MTSQGVVSRLFISAGGGISGASEFWNLLILPRAWKLNRGIDINFNAWKLSSIPSESQVFWRMLRLRGLPTSGNPPLTSVSPSGHTFAISVMTKVSILAIPLLLRQLTSLSI